MYLVVDGVNDTVLTEGVVVGLVVRLELTKTDTDCDGEMNGIGASATKIDESNVQTSPPVVPLSMKSHSIFKSTTERKRNRKRKRKRKKTLNDCSSLPQSIPKIH